MLLVSLLTASAWTPTPDEQKLVAALSSRDGAPPCALLADLVDDPVTAHQRVVEHVAMPPWAPMGAARCLIEDHAAEVEPLLVSWLEGDDTRGLARLVVLSLPELEQDLAVRLGKVAMRGPHAAILGRRIRADVRPAVQATAGGQ
jgi:hypothetical protein